MFVKFCITSKTKKNYFLVSKFKKVKGSDFCITVGESKSDKNQNLFRAKLYF